MSQESTTTQGQRRLAAIVFTDVAGYSARMQRDEIGTMTLVRADFERMRALCSQQGGEVLKSTGDGLLMCFGSVVQAVGCALQIQQEFGLRPTDALQHRIGIHLGDVFREGGDVAGDGVNLAARLQTKARPGTLCVSQSVYDAVKGKLPLQAEALGPQTFKNIAEPLPVYLLTPAGTVVPWAAGTGPVRRRRRGPVVAGIVLLLGIIGTAYFLLRPAAAPRGPAQTAPAPAVVADRSIAVLPFTNMSEDKDNAYFADGVHEDILTDLANVGGLKVISRTSVMQYRGTTKPLREIGAELDVAYILEGSVRRAGNKVRVTGQLIEARTDKHVWAKTYDRDLTDIFAIQAQLASEIALALQAAITPQEQAKLGAHTTTNLAAYELFVRARLLRQDEGSNRSANSLVVSLLEEAVQLDPQFADAWASLAEARILSFRRDVSLAEQRAKAKDELDKASRLAPNSLEVLLVQHGTSWVFGQVEVRVKAAEQIARLYPNRAETRLVMASEARLAARWREGLADVERAVSLDPRGLDTLNFALVYQQTLRRYEKVEALWQVIAGVRPLTEEKRWRQALNRFSHTGSMEMGDALLATYSPEALRTDARTVAYASSWYYVMGDAAAVIRLWQESGPNWRYSNYYSGFDLLSVATSYLKLGQREAALPLLRKNLDLVRAESDSQPENWQALGDLALNHALLGEVETANRQLAKAEALVRELKSSASRANLQIYRACTLAWLDRKSEATDLIAANINQPGVFEIWQVPALRRSILFWPLQGDPAFEAMLKDPKNSAPLL